MRNRVVIPLYIIGSISGLLYIFSSMAGFWVPEFIWVSILVTVPAFLLDMKDKK